jgi:hypothetical protein
MDALSSPIPPSAGGSSAAAIDALLAVLRPLAQLAIDHGVQFNQLEELTKRAMVEAAIRATAGEGPGGGQAPVSRLSVITGIHRKEVKRLAEASDLSSVHASQTPTTELFTRWVTDPAWRDADGRARELPRRSGEDAPSFEKLARAVTTDVHPRTLLDEMLRLELVELDARTDTVRLRAEAFVPATRIEDLLGFVGANIGDHLSAARENVAAALRAAGGDATARAPFVEQALFADALSAESARAAGDQARAFWGRLLRAMAPELQRMEDLDRAAGRTADRRVRIGLYCYAEQVAPAAEPQKQDTDS